MLYDLLQAIAQAHPVESMSAAIVAVLLFSGLIAAQ